MRAPERSGTGYGRGVTPRPCSSAPYYFWQACPLPALKDPPCCNAHASRPCGDPDGDPRERCGMHWKLPRCRTGIWYV